MLPPWVRIILDDPVDCHPLLKGYKGGLSTPSLQETSQPRGEIALLFGHFSLTKMYI
jgi:hypothetical protein